MKKWKMMSNSKVPTLKAMGFVMPKAIGQGTYALFHRFVRDLKVYSGVSSLGLPGVPWHPQILADQLTLSQPGGTDYAHHSTTSPPGFSDLPTALSSRCNLQTSKYFFG